MLFGKEVRNQGGTSNRTASVERYRFSICVM